VVPFPFEQKGFKAQGKKMTHTEQDSRLDILNTLLTTPHRKLDKVHPVHEAMIKRDPLFYARLGAWYTATGDIRDHKEMFVIQLCQSEVEGHRDVGLAMLREMPPYQVARVVDFIHGRKKTKTITEEIGVGRNKRKQTRKVIEEFGLFKNIPRSMKTEVVRYLREREADNSWFDSCVMQARKYLKRLYAVLHIEPSERAQKILFDGEPPTDSSLAAVKALNKCETAADQARVIIEKKIPYRVASTVVTAMTPTVVLALVEVMTPQELINNLGSLKARGAFDNPKLKEVISEKLEKAKTNKRVAALKATKAGLESGMSSDIQKQLEDVADTKLKSKGRITRPTALLIDKSGSMAVAIDLGKKIASMVSAIMDADLFVYAFDEMAYPIVANGEDVASWDKAFKYITSGGRTSCGAPIEFLRRNKQRVEQIVMVGDEGENTSPMFLTSLQNYQREMDVEVQCVFVKCGHHASSQLEGMCQRNNIPYTAWDFNGDYYSIPELIPFLTQQSRLDLLMEIMAYPLPERKTA
jgi:hypothetical protein